MMECQVYHNSHEKFCREPFGAVACGQPIVLRLFTSSPAPDTACWVRFWELEQEKLLPMQVFRGEPKAEVRGSKFELRSSKSGVWSPESGVQENALSRISTGFDGKLTVFEVEYTAPAGAGLVWYYFIITDGNGTFYYGNNEQRLGGEGRRWEQQPPAYQITVYRPMRIPDWYRQGIMYQIFVDRFYDGREEGERIYPRKNALIHANWEDDPVYIRDEQERVTHWDFFGGNLKGVLKKLPYLKELGISILYLNPIFDSPSNHKYDTADYLKIDPMYGDERSLELLLAGAKRCGIAVILDGVFNHTGSDSIYFNQYGTFPDLGAYQSADSPYYEWYLKSGRGEFQYWWNIASLPEVDEMNPAYRRFIYGSENSVIQKWMSKGVAGWRLDVADELPDEFIQELRQAVKELDPDALLIGEVWEDASNKVSYGKLREYFWGAELDATMNYPFRTFFLDFLLGRSDARLLHDQVMSLWENYPRENFFAAMNLIGSHDRARILTLLGEAPAEEGSTATERRVFRLAPAARQLAVQRLKLLSLVQMTFPGVPCTYYGDEAGREGYSDPFNRGTYPWGKEDPEILAWYKRMFRLRLEYEVLQTGDFSPFYSGPDVYGFQRLNNGEKIVVLINRHPEQAGVVDLSQGRGTGDLDLAQGSGSGNLSLDLLTGERISQEQAGKLSLVIPPLSGRIILSKKGTPALRRRSLPRSCGVLLHISSLPSVWGMGDLGEEAYRFVDFLCECGQSIWQILPLNPPGLGNSPYQSDSLFAGNPLFISLEQLLREGLLHPEDVAEKLKQASRPSPDIKQIKRDLLRLAWQSFQARPENNNQDSGDPESGREMSMYSSKHYTPSNYRKFLRENAFWLEDYALFQALKTHFGDVAWYDWEQKIAGRNQEAIKDYSFLLAEEIEFNSFVQFIFYQQWTAIQRYAGEKGVKIVGDLPFYVAADSCDVWVNRRFFALAESGRPAKVAGVPPDYFSRTGQLWGNPVYDWDALASERYSWWKQRVRLALRLFDFVRLDHFRGLEGYWEVDAGEKTAVRGRWMKGPGKMFLESLTAEFGELPLLAEDLGVITPEVQVLKRLFGFPGMKVLQFTPPAEGLAGQDPNFVYYSGTHDNNTLLGWYKSILRQQDQAGQAYFKKKQSFTEGPALEERKNFEGPGRGGEPRSFEAEEDIGNPRLNCRKLIEDLYLSGAAWVILPLQDILGLDSDARMNVPGTPEGNWKWQMTKEQLNSEVRSWLRILAEKSGRSVKDFEIELDKLDKFPLKNR